MASSSLCPLWLISLITSRDGSPCDLSVASLICERAMRKPLGPQDAEYDIVLVRVNSASVARSKNV